MTDQEKKGLGIIALLMLLFGRKRTDPSSIEWGTGWMWPVPTLYPPWSPDTGYPAVVSSGFGLRGNGKEHRGMDVMYKRRDLKDAAEFPPRRKNPKDGFVDGSTMHFAPPGTPILAAKEGRVWSVQNRPDGGGWSVVIDHGKPWATYYTHLRDVKFYEAIGGKRKDGGPVEYVTQGQELGSMGGNLSDSELLRHLHWEMWYKGAGPGGSASVDPQAANIMVQWKRAAWTPQTL